MNLELSSHIELLMDCGILYHRLFGNACFVDPELVSRIPLLRTPRPERSLRDELGDEVFERLYQHYYLVEEPTVERSLIARELAEREVKLSSGYFLEALQISSSNLCNFSCSYCFADASDRRSAKRKHISENQPTLEFEVAVQAIDQMFELVRSHGREVLGVKFLGREPLVNWRTIDRLLRHYRDSPVRWSITSNGALITQQIAERLAEHKVMIVVSLDGPPETNNALRVLKSKGATFELIVRGLQYLRGARACFGVSSVISNATRFDSFLPFMRYLSEVGAKELELTLAMQTRQFAPQGHLEGVDALEAFLLAAYELGEELGLLIHGDWVDPFHRILVTRRSRSDSATIRPIAPGCSATSHQLSLESSGDLFPCRAMSNHYGHIDNLSAALQSEEYRQVGMRTLCNVPFCRGCVLEGMCQGTCLGSCQEAHGDIYTPQHDYCHVYRRMTRKLLSYYGSKRKYENRNVVRGARSVGASTQSDYPGGW